VSTSSIGTQTTIASSSTGIQTSLSLSSPKKAHLYRKIQQYKKQIAVLPKRSKRRLNALFALLDKFYPKETSNFLTQQAVLLQKKDKR